ncbi:ketoacyl-ACP synthase III [candidate division KSB1 bacterium]|nr:ketoacyl-ACP synthase III [candidate division KSB1 bacterium]RQW00286.1 MAG: ketoacyl-ACP synthase III [candidate division KSB1 bacterium]
MLSTLNYPAIKSLTIDRYARVLSTSVTVPETVVTNDDIIKRYDLIATDRAVQFAVGIKERRYADDHTLVSDLLAETALVCLDRANVRPEQLDRIIYTKLMGDYIVPATSIKVLQKLGMRSGIPAFDIAAACSGFAHILDMAIRYIDSGDDYVLILGGDISSRSANTKNKKDTRTIFLSGDAVVGMLLGVSDEQHFLASYLYTDNTYYEYSYIPFGTEMLNKTKAFDNTMFNMQMPDGMVVHESVIDSCDIVANKLLQHTGLSIDDIDVFITSDQTTMTWEAQLRKMGVPREKSASLFHKYGNTVAALAPVNLNEMIESGRLQRGMTVMFLAHGAGASGGGFIFTY